MDNLVKVECPQCERTNGVRVSEEAAEQEVVRCGFCGQPMATIGQLHAQVAQEAIGLGATDLRDDHVPVDGELGERPNQ